MSLTDFAAIVGALAWIPPIFTAGRAWLTKPEVRIITQPSPEIGYTTFGPILNLRLALTVKHKDIVVTGIQLLVQHESGEETVFSWRGIVQRMGQMTYPQVGAVPFEKEPSVLAVKVSLKDVEERFIRFQSLAYVESKADLESVSLKTLAYLRQSGTQTCRSQLGSAVRSNRLLKFDFECIEAMFRMVLDPLPAPRKPRVARSVRSFSKQGGMRLCFSTAC